MILTEYARYMTNIDMPLVGVNADKRPARTGACWAGTGRGGRMAERQDFGELSDGTISP
jgi:hypothetical protein